MIKNSIFFSLLITLLTCNNLFAQHKFYVNLNDRSDDLFHVTVFPENLTSENGVYNFAATAPGTYQLMNIGRFVESFKAYDSGNNEIEVKNISLNRWSISAPDKVSKIVYSIKETWDTPVEENKIYLMAGSSIEDDNVLMNNQCIFGYFDNMQDFPINIKIDYPMNWTVGTAMTKNSEGYYTAVNYDYLVDSPVLLGELSEASIDINGTDVEIFTYSKTDLIKSDDLLNAVEDILYAADKFTEGLPVDRYAFLFHFEDESAGAWEHSYSSIYVYPEFPLSQNYANNIRSTVAHEFFHIVTPLNIHSELISSFNFADPKLSKHIWLYESVTEWASDAMQLRAGIMDLNEYVSELKGKLDITENFRSDLSLTELAVNSFNLQDQFYLFYCKGSVIMTLLDLELLRLSGGKQGLREVINELSQIYGPDKSFSENDFFNEFVERTNPEIGEFFEKYVKGNEPLPIKEYMQYVGVDYTENAGFDSSKGDFDFGFGFSNGKLNISILNDDSLPVKVGDVFYKYGDVELTSQNMGKIFNELSSKKPGEKVRFIMKREDKEIEFNYVLKAAEIKHIFKINENPTDQQLKLRKAWVSNL